MGRTPGRPLSAALRGAARWTYGHNRLWTPREAFLHSLGRPSFDPFPGLSPDPGQRARILERPAAERTYAVVFTPRSGSSRLTEILTRARWLGRPGEHFNPAFVRRTAQHLGARDLPEYVALLKRHHATLGTFGLKATWRHVQRLFGSADRFRALVAPNAWLWLVREDIVLQAVSISRMVQTEIAHNLPDVGNARLADADTQFRYDGQDIAGRLLAIRALERGGEAMFARLKVAPLRLSYERLLPMEPGALARRIAAHVGAEVSSQAIFEDLRHRRLGTDKNLDFARRFRAENAGLVARVERARVPMLTALEEPSDG
jgi:LPS sulfotransferase NodH